MSEPDRYEPLPSVTALPGWIWRRVGRRARIGVVVLVALAAVAAVPVTLEIQDTKRRDAASERAERARQRAATIERLRAEQRPRSGRSVVGATPARLRADLAAAVLADARRRARSGEFESLAKRAVCEPIEDGRWTCTAVTAEDRTVYSGLPYRALADARTGRFAFCKVSGQAELTRRPLVQTPRACGGG